MRIAIEAVPLIGRWSLSDAWRRDRAAWPPAPDTLFSALVAAAAGAGWGEPSPPDDVIASRHGRTLAWLEMLGPPEIDAPLDPGRVEGLTWFVPVGDDANLDQARTRKARHHNSVGADGPVRWAWRVEPGAATREQAAALAEIAAGVTHVGSSRGPVLAVAKLVDDDAWRPSLVPAADGGTLVRGIYPGRLDDLERWFRAGERPQPGPAVAYARPEDLALESRWGDILVLRKRSGLALDVAPQRRHRRSRAQRAPGPSRRRRGGGPDRARRGGGGLAPRPSGHRADGADRRRPRRRRGAGRRLGPAVGHDDAVWLELVAAVGRWMAAAGGWRSAGPPAGPSSGRPTTAA